MKPYRLAINLGRMHIPHNGHKYLIKHMLSLADQCVIAMPKIDDVDLYNPHSYEQRQHMLSLLFPKELESSKLKTYQPKNYTLNNVEGWRNFISDFHISPECTLLCVGDKKSTQDQKNIASLRKITEDVGMHFKAIDPIGNMSVGEIIRTPFGEDVFRKVNFKIINFVSSLWATAYERNIPVHDVKLDDINYESARSTILKLSREKKTLVMNDDGEISVCCVDLIESGKHLSL